MISLVYDGTFQGFLTAVYEVYALKINDARIWRSELYTPQLFGNEIQVETNDEKYQRVLKRLQNILGKDGVNALWKVTLSELPEYEIVLLGVIRHVLNTQQNVLTDYAHPQVLAMSQILKMIGRERHRMTAFVRFELATDGVYHATIEPDFDVIPLIAHHFKNRYADQQWLIFDVRRGYGIYYDLKRVLPVEPVTDTSTKPVISIEWSEEEQQYQELWKQYFKSTTIVSRKNTKLHLQHVPKRYWKYLTEKR